MMAALALSRGRAGSFENRAPTFVSIAAIIAYSWKGSEFFSMAIENNLNIGNGYAAIFDIATIFAAFLFTFYGMLLTSNSGFIRRLKETTTYRDFVVYLIRAIIMSAIVSLSSVPLIVVSPMPVDKLTMAYWLVGIWVSLVVGCMACFARALTIFVLISRVPEHRSFPGG